MKITALSIFIILTACGRDHHNSQSDLQSDQSLSAESSPAVACAMVFSRVDSNRVTQELQRSPEKSLQLGPNEQAEKFTLALDAFTAEVELRRDCDQHGSTCASPFTLEVSISAGPNRSLSATRLDVSDVGRKLHSALQLGNRQGFVQCASY